MKRFEIKYSAGATPLEDEERDGLIPDYITTHGELNQLEQANIQVALLWVRQNTTINPIEIAFLYRLHRNMFGDVWRWAGKQRKSQKNIGVDKAMISTELGSLLADVAYWIENKTFSWDDIGARFHHRLVWIHAFPNGNGRHARMLCDLLMEVNGQDLFTWGKKMNPIPMEVDGARRKAYIHALVTADRGDYQPLITFARS